MTTLKIRLCYLLIMTTISGCLPYHPITGSPGTNDPFPGPFWATGAGSITERFELAKRSEPELIVFLRNMPKGGDLHNHATGATYSDYLLQSAMEQELNYNLITDKFTHDPPQTNKVVSIEELISDSSYLNKFLDIFSMRGWRPNTTNGHDHFFQTFSRINSAGRSKEDILAEMLERNAYENIQYLEIMTSSAPESVIQIFNQRLTDFDPNSLEQAYTQLLPLINSQDVTKKIRDFLDQRNLKIQEILDSHNADIKITGSDPDIVIRYIPQLYRTRPLRNFFIDAVVAITLINSDERVVALNIVQAEDDPRSLKNFYQHMHILDFLWTRMGKPKFALHAGELVLDGSPVEAMRDRISSSIFQGHALRVGHGVSIAWEDRAVNVMDYMKKNGILVEICLTSNESILGVTGNAHPFMMYRRSGVPVSINTDDEGVSRSNQTMEYVKAVSRYNLSYPEVVELVRNSIEYSFIPGESLFEARDYSKINSHFIGLRQENWHPSEIARGLMDRNLKINMQVRLERDLARFERQAANGFR